MRALLITIMGIMLIGCSNPVEPRAAEQITANWQWTAFPGDDPTDPISIHVRLQPTDDCHAYIHLTGQYLNGDLYELDWEVDLQKGYWEYTVVTLAPDVDGVTGGFITVTLTGGWIDEQHWGVTP
jgi:hypothetical protein